MGSTRPSTSSTRVCAQGGFTLIELMMVVAILSVLAVVAIGAYSRQVRNAHKTEVVADLSNLTLRQKTFFAKSGHFASSTNCEGPDCTYPLATGIATARGPVAWVPTDASYTSAAVADSEFFRGGAAVHGFDALQFMPDGANSWCGYATISGWGSTAEAGNDDVPPNFTLANQIFPTGTEPYFARDWFYSYALCDFDFDGVYWAFTSAHYSAEVKMNSDSTGQYLENE